MPQALSPPGEFSSWSGGPQKGQELSWRWSPERGLPGPHPPGPASALLSCSGPGGSQEPRRRGDCPLAFPGLGPGPPPRPPREPRVQKATVREWPRLPSGGEAASPRPLSGSPGTPAPRRCGAQARPLVAEAPPRPGSHPLSTPQAPACAPDSDAQAGAPDGPQCGSVAPAFRPHAPRCSCSSADCDEPCLVPGTGETLSPGHSDESWSQGAGSGSDAPL